MKFITLIVFYQLFCFCNYSKKTCTEIGLLRNNLDSLMNHNFRAIEKDKVDSLKNVYYQLGVKEIVDEDFTIFINFSQGNTNYANILLIQVDTSNRWSVYYYKAPYNMKDSLSIFKKTKLVIPTQEKICWLEKKLVENKIFELQDGAKIKGYPSWTGGTGASIKFFYNNKYWTYGFGHPDETEETFEEPKKFMNILRHIKEVFNVDLAKD
jgi:hypothetical protein